MAPVLLRHQHEPDRASHGRTGCEPGDVLDEPAAGGRSLWGRTSKRLREHGLEARLWAKQDRQRGAEVLAKFKCPPEKVWRHMNQKGWSEVVKPQLDRGLLIRNLDALGIGSPLGPGERTLRGRPRVWRWATRALRRWLLPTRSRRLQRRPPSVEVYPLRCQRRRRQCGSCRRLCSSRSLWATQASKHCTSEGRRRCRSLLHLFPHFCAAYSCFLWWGRVTKQQHKSAVVARRIVDTQRQPPWPSGTRCC